MGYKIAIAGATGNVGREILAILHEREFPVREVVALASRSSLGKEVSFGDTEILRAESLEHYDFTGTDIAFFTAGGERSKLFAPKAAEQGCIVIDNSSHFRMNEDIPLIVPEVNAHHLGQYKKTNIIANPNCSTIQMVMVLKPLSRLANIKRVIVSTYQSVSGAGKTAMDELYDQTKGMYLFTRPEPKAFTKQIAFNVIPHIDIFMEDGSTKEERKIVQETKKIMDYDIKVSATCARVPVFIGHSESVNIEFDSEVSLKDAIHSLKNAPGVRVLDKKDDGGYMTPVEVVKEDLVYVSRIRKDETVEQGLNLWIVADNLRKGAALNAVQIAEELVRSHNI